jgi:hypothetical protein
LFAKFGDLGNALQYAYPEIEWDLTKFPLRGKKSGQRWLKISIEELMPGVEIVEDYLHPEMGWGVSPVILYSRFSHLCLRGLRPPRGIGFVDAGLSHCTRISRYEFSIADFLLI